LDAEAEDERRDGHVARVARGADYPGGRVIDRCGV
jgi:hypothetical protein